VFNTRGQFVFLSRFRRRHSDNNTVMGRHCQTFHNSQGELWLLLYSENTRISHKNERPT
jgi:hypothetical protein